MSDYRSEAVDDARDTVSEFKDTILEQLLEDGEASKDCLTTIPMVTPTTMSRTLTSGTILPMPPS
jgi:hypothetical protein